MAAAPETIAAPAGLSWFSQDRLPPLLTAFEAEITGVRAAEDIEYIHRMRVASRRLRAALPIFRPCFSKKQYLRWMHGITTITRALGEARDADVQIAFLTKYKKRRITAWKSRHADTALPEPMEPAISYLLQELRENRKAHQEHVNAALAALEKSGVTGEMHAAFSMQSAAFRKTPVQALARAWLRRGRLCSCRLVCDNLCRQSPQLPLFAETREKERRQEGLLAAMDAIRSRYGQTLIATGRQRCAAAEPAAGGAAGC